MPQVRRLAPPLVWMGAIFLFSAQADLTTGLGTADLIARKVVHMLEYALLWWLWHRALGGRRPILAAAITVLYAATDEYHQSHVEGRHGTPVDVAIDAVGVTLAWWAVRARGHGRHDRLPQPRR